MTPPEIRSFDRQSEAYGWAHGVLSHALAQGLRVEVRVGPEDPDGVRPDVPERWRVVTVELPRRVEGCRGYQVFSLGQEAS